MTYACLAVAFPLAAQQVTYSFDEAYDLMVKHSPSLKVADAEVQMARRERGRANALWWPQLQANGMYAHMSEDIEVRAPLSQFTDPAKEYIQRIAPGEELVTGLLDRVGEYVFTFPLIPQDVASVGLTAEWVAFSGGKRVFADRVARELVYVAQIGCERALSAERVRLV